MDDPFEDVSGTREQILAATYEALREHGYADLTIKRIGEAFEKSPSLIYHHYDGKDELVVDCMEFILDRFEERIFSEGASEDPREDLERLVHQVFEPEERNREATVTLVQLRARAGHDEAYREHFQRSDRVFERYLTDVVRAGVENGDFRECPPETVASFVVTTISGTILRRATVDDADEPGTWHERTREELDSYLRSRVYEPEETS